MSFISSDFEWLFISPSTLHPSLNLILFEKWLLSYFNSDTYEFESQYVPILDKAGTSLPLEVIITLYEYYLYHCPVHYFKPPTQYLISPIQLTKAKIIQAFAPIITASLSAAVAQYITSLHSLPSTSQTTSSSPETPSQTFHSSISSIFFAQPTVTQLSQFTFYIESPSPLSQPHLYTQTLSNTHQLHQTFGSALHALLLTSLRYGQPPNHTLSAYIEKLQFNTSSSTEVSSSNSIDPTTNTGPQNTSIDLQYLLSARYTASLSLQLLVWVMKFFTLASFYELIYIPQLFSHHIVSSTTIPFVTTSQYNFQVAQKQLLSTTPTHLQSDIATNPLAISTIPSSVYSLIQSLLVPYLYTALMYYPHHNINFIYKSIPSLQHHEDFNLSFEFRYASHRNSFSPSSFEDQLWQSRELALLSFQLLYLGFFSLWVSYNPNSTTSQSIFSQLTHNVSHLTRPTPNLTPPEQLLDVASLLLSNLLLSPSHEDKTQPILQFTDSSTIDPDANTFKSSSLPITIACETFTPLPFCIHITTIDTFISFIFSHFYAPVYQESYPSSLPQSSPEQLSASPQTTSLIDSLFSSQHYFSHLHQTSSIYFSQHINEDNIFYSLPMFPSYTHLSSNPKFLTIYPSLLTTLNTFYSIPTSTSQTFPAPFATSMSSTSLTPTFLSLRYLVSHSLRTLTELTNPYFLMQLSTLLTLSPSPWLFTQFRDAPLTYLPSYNPLTYQLSNDQTKFLAMHQPYTQLQLFFSPNPSQYGNISILFIPNPIECETFLRNKQLSSGDIKSFQQHFGLTLLDYLPFEKLHETMDPRLQQTLNKLKRQEDATMSIVERMNLKESETGFFKPPQSSYTSPHDPLAIEEDGYSTFNMATNYNRRSQLEIYRPEDLQDPIASKMAHGKSSFANNTNNNRMSVNQLIGIKLFPFLTTIYPALMTNCADILFSTSYHRTLLLRVPDTFVPHAFQFANLFSSLTNSTTDFSQSHFSPTPSAYTTLQSIRFGLIIQPMLSYLRTSEYSLFRLTGLHLAHHFLKYIKLTTTLCQFLHQLLPQQAQNSSPLLNSYQIKPSSTNIGNIQFNQADFVSTTTWEFYLLHPLFHSLFSSTPRDQHQLINTLQSFIISSVSVQSRPHLPSNLPSQTYNPALEPIQASTPLSITSTTATQPIIPVYSTTCPLFSIYTSNLTTIPHVLDILQLGKLFFSTLSPLISFRTQALSHFYALFAFIDAYSLLFNGNAKGFILEPIVTSFPQFQHTPKTPVLIQHQQVPETPSQQITSTTIIQSLPPKRYPISDYYDLDTIFVNTPTETSFLQMTSSIIQFILEQYKFIPTMDSEMGGQDTNKHLVTAFEMVYKIYPTQAPMNQLFYYVPDFTHKSRISQLALHFLSSSSLEIDTIPTALLTPTPHSNSPRTEHFTTLQEELISSIFRTDYTLFSAVPSQVAFNEAIQHIHQSSTKYHAQTISPTNSSSESTDMTSSRCDYAPSLSSSLHFYPLSATPYHITIQTLLAHIQLCSLLSPDSLSQHFSTLLSPLFNFCGINDDHHYKYQILVKSLALDGINLVFNRLLYSNLANTLSIPYLSLQQTQSFFQYIQSNGTSSPIKPLPHPLFVARSFEFIESILLICIDHSTAFHPFFNLTSWFLRQHQHKKQHSTILALPNSLASSNVGNKNSVFTLFSVLLHGSQGRALDFIPKYQSLAKSKIPTLQQVDLSMGTADEFFNPNTQPSSHIFNPKKELKDNNKKKSIKNNSMGVIGATQDEDEDEAANQIIDQFLQNTAPKDIFEQYSQSLLFSTNTTPNILLSTIATTNYKLHGWNGEGLAFDINQLNRLLRGEEEPNNAIATSINDNTNYDQHFEQKFDDLTQQFNVVELLISETPSASDSTQKSSSETLELNSKWIYDDEDIQNDQNIEEQDIIVIGKPHHSLIEVCGSSDDTSKQDDDIIDLTFQNCMKNIESKFKQIEAFEQDQNKNAHPKSALFSLESSTLDSSKPCGSIIEIIEDITHESPIEETSFNISSHNNKTNSLFVSTQLMVGSSYNSHSQALKYSVPVYSTSIQQPNPASMIFEDDSTPNENSYHSFVFLNTYQSIPIDQYTLQNSPKLRRPSISTTGSCLDDNSALISGPVQDIQWAINEDLLLSEFSLLFSRFSHLLSLIFSSTIRWNHNSPLSQIINTQLLSSARHRIPNGEAIELLQALCDYNWDSKFSPKSNVQNILPKLLVEVQSKSTFALIGAPNQPLSSSITSKLYSIDEFVQLLLDPSLSHLVEPFVQKKSTRLQQIKTTTSICKFSLALTKPKALCKSSSNQILQQKSEIEFHPEFSPNVMVDGIEYLIGDYVPIISELSDIAFILFLELGLY